MDITLQTKVKEKISLLIFSLIVSQLSAQTVIFEDTFDTSLTSGSETDVNFEIGGGRQVVGSSTYTEQDKTGIGGFIKVYPNFSGGGFINVYPSFSGGALMLRNAYQNGIPSVAGVVLDQNLAGQLEGQHYRVSFDALFTRGTIGPDRWMGVYLMGALPTVINNANVNNAATDFALLLRDDGRANVWDDGSVLTNFPTRGTTPVVTGTVYSVLLDINETILPPEVTVTVAGSLLGTFSIDFDEGDTNSRYIGFSAQTGGAAGGIDGQIFDARYDNVKIDIIPEPSAHALFGSLFAMLCLFMRHRR